MGLIILGHFGSWKLHLFKSSWTNSWKEKKAKQQKFQNTKLLAHKVPEPQSNWRSGQYSGVMTLNFPGHWLRTTVKRLTTRLDGPLLWLGKAISTVKSQHVSVIHHKFFSKHWIYVHRLHSFDKSTSTSENPSQRKYSNPRCWKL